MSLRTVKDSEVNQVSDEIKNYLKERALKPGQIAKYRLLGGVKNTDPQKHGGLVLYPSCITIALRDTIYDKSLGDAVTIGKVQEVSRDGDIVFAQLAVFPSKNDPYFFLSGDKVEDIQTFEVLELISTNKSSPYRSTNVEAVFERVDEVSESNNRSKKRDYLIDSYMAIRGWKPEHLRIMGAGYNVPTTLDLSIIRERLETIADANPELFYKTIDSPETEAKALILMGKEAGVINYTAHENKWAFTDSGEVLAVLPRVEGAEPTVQLAQVLLSAANGGKLRATIEKLVTAKNKK